MGWGICFGLNEHGRVYCSDGCKWSSTAADYVDYPQWPSAAQAVLDYFKEDAHRELDMIRDECPGTAAALREACEEHMAYALGRYEGLSDVEKTEMHNSALEEYNAKLESLKISIPVALEAYRDLKKEWNSAFKKSGPQRKRKAPRTRAEEIEREMEPLELELELERAAARVDNMRKQKAQTVRLLNREKKFEL
jgi:hypothetical protein